MKQEMSKRLETALNDIVNQFATIVAMGAVATTLGLDFGQSQQGLIDAAIQAIEDIVSEIVAEIMSVDGVSDLIEMWEQIAEICFFVQNFGIWLTSPSTGVKDLEDFKSLLEDLKGWVSDLHDILEKVDEYTSEEQGNLNEPNDQNDE